MTRLEGARVILRALVLTALAAPPVAAQQPPATAKHLDVAPRIGVSAALGVSWPSDVVVGDVYGSTIPISVQGDVRLYRHIAVFAGFKSISTQGQSIVLGPALTDERYPTSLTISSLRFGATVAFPLASRLTAGGSVGVAVNWYEERWPYAQATAKGRPSGVVVQAEVRYAIHSRWSAVGRLEYAPVTAQAVDTTSGSSVTLGGVDLSAGIRVGF